MDANIHEQADAVINVVYAQLNYWPSPHPSRSTMLMTLRMEFRADPANTSRRPSPSTTAADAE